MRCLVFAFAMVFAGCSSYSQLGSGGSGDSRGAGPSDGSETTVVWMDSPGALPSVGYFDVQTIFNLSELGPGSYIRVAAIHITGTAREALVNKLRLSASQIGANRLLIVKVEETREEVSLYSELENVARFFSGEKTDADRSNQAYTLRIDAIAIRHTDDLTNIISPRQGQDWPTVYRPRTSYDRPTVYRPRRPRRPYDRPSIYRPPRRDNRPTAKPPPRRDDRRPVNPPIPKDEPPIVAPPPPKNERPPDRTPSPPPPPKDEPPAVKPPLPPPEEDRPSRKQPRMKTHRP